VTGNIRKNPKGTSRIGNLLGCLILALIKANYPGEHQSSQTPLASAEMPPVTRHDLTRALRRERLPMQIQQTPARAAARVINLPRKSKPKPHQTKRAAPGRRVHVAAADVLAVALVLLGLSLSHLAAGIALVAGAGNGDALDTGLEQIGAKNAKRLLGK
jgi:hypothetical protein